MEVSVSQADLDLLTGYYRFCRGYTIPDDVTLGDVLHVFENAIQCFGDDEGESARDMVADMRDTLAKFKKED